MPTSHRRAHGQYFTRGNPFVWPAFRQWFDAIPHGRECTVLEPFAGAGHLPGLLRQAGYVQPWAGYDIDPPAKSLVDWPVHRRDTLRDFPQGFSVAITNPPYLAKNSARRRGLGFPSTRFEDLYLVALEKMLEHVPYVAAIVPESFVVSGLFRDRLLSTVSLVSPMFSDTQCPVCLALFVPAARKSETDFNLFREDVALGTYAQALAHLPAAPVQLPWRFNAPAGEIGLRGVDNHRHNSIAFVPGVELASTPIKTSSRALTRIAGCPPDCDPAVVAQTANALLAQYRAQTQDALMTAFKGLRSDGRYRRRLDFATARRLLDAAVQAHRAGAQKMLC